MNLNLNQEIGFWKKNSRKKINYNDIEPSQEEPKKEDNTGNYSNRWKFRRPEAKRKSNKNGKSKPKSKPKDLTNDTKDIKQKKPKKKRIFRR